MEQRSEEKVSNSKQVKSCNNCKYFRQHYILRGGAVFCKTNFGHCATGDISLSRRMQFEDIRDCKRWKLLEENNEDKNRTVKNLLEEIEKRLADVKFLLTCK